MGNIVREYIMTGKGIVSGNFSDANNAKFERWLENHITDEWSNFPISDMLDCELGDYISLTRSLDDWRFFNSLYDSDTMKVVFAFAESLYSALNYYDTCNVSYFVSMFLGFSYVAEKFIDTFEIKYSKE